jgi:O-methyltransferase involved in polyketide biosynthesis
MLSSQTQDADSSIRLTDTDAALARLSAVQKGYLQDPYIKHLVPRSHLQPPRPPLINIGTFVRATAIDDLVFQWLQSSANLGTRCQIVSLGSGSDTRFWRIAVRSTPILRLGGLWCRSDRPAPIKMPLLRMLRWISRRLRARRPWRYGKAKI